MEEKKQSFWKDIWDKKGESVNNDLLFLDGYEHLNIEFSSEKICNFIKDEMKIKKDDLVLEVGCGAGFLTQNMEGIYTGVDYSEPLVEKNKNFFNKSVFVCEANKLNFENKRFDKTFCYGVFQYFPSYKYARQTIEEMIRVSKDCVFIGDLKTFGNENHLSYQKDCDIFSKLNIKISKCIYNPEDETRFNVLVKV